MRKQQRFAYDRFLRYFLFSAVVLTLLAITGQQRFWTDRQTQAVFGFQDEEKTPQIAAKWLNTLSEEELQTQPETDPKQVVPKEWNVTAADLENLKSLDYLKSHFYIVDSRTQLWEGDIQAEEFLNMDFTLDQSTDGPKVLIFHTHSQEKFADSKDVTEGVWGAGERLKQQLEEKYGIEVLHHDGVYDVVDGKSQILGAYDRMEPDIRRVLEENPSIELVIDLHRDGVYENTHLVETINGKPCAKIRFFNGMCRLVEDGVASPIDSLPNPYLTENLALSFQMQLAANALYPNWTRRVYVNAYRYSLHMKPKSLLIELGAQTNTYEEALNAMDLLADVIAAVVG